MTGRQNTSILRFGAFCFLAQALLFTSGALGEALQPAMIEAKLARYEKDTSIACEHQSVSEAREMNANFTIQRIETQWDQVKDEIRKRQNYLNTVDKFLSTRVHDELIESRDILEHERLQTEKAQGKVKASHELNLKKAEETVKRLQELSDGFKKRSQGVNDPVTQKYIDTEVSKVQQEITEYSHLSDRHEALLRSAQLCWASAGPIGTQGRVPYTEPGANTGNGTATAGSGTSSSPPLLIPAK